LWLFVILYDKMIFNSR